jgi:hypothetical protein
MALYKKGEHGKAKIEFEKTLSLNERFEGAEEAKRILAEL